MQTSTERYLGFYLSRPFWAVNEIDLSNGIPSGFSNLMGEEVFQYEDPEFKLKVCRDGRFLLRINPKSSSNNNTGDHILSIETWSHYLKYANAAVLLFESIFINETNKFGYFETRELTNKDAFGVRYENGIWNGESITDLSLAREFQNARLGILSQNGLHVSHHPLFQTRRVIPVSIFEKFADTFNHAFKNEWLISLLSLLIKSISEFKVANFDTALIISWFIVESIVQEKWSLWIHEKNGAHVDINKKRIDAGRKKQLNGRDFPISVKMNILELNDCLPHELFQKLDTTRKYRNKITHQNSKYRCTLSDAKAAIETSNELIDQHFQFKITLNLSLTISGL